MTISNFAQALATFVLKGGNGKDERRQNCLARKRTPCRSSEWISPYRSAS